MARPCLEPGCPELVDRGYCTARGHAQARNARKMAEPHRWVYTDARWYRCRRRALARAGGRCEVVEDGERCPVDDRALLHGHHHPVGVRDLLGRGLDPFDEAGVVIACDVHHGRLEALLRAELERR